MSLANFSRRKKLLYNIMQSGLSNTDKMIYYALHHKYIDGEQFLEFLETNPSHDAIVEYVESKLRENRISDR